MFDQKNQSSKAKPRQLSAHARRCLTEALEDRRLFAVSLVTVAPDGVTPGNGDSSEASVSANGRYVAFASFANNLVAGDTNNKKDVFLRDLQTGVTTLISKSPTTGLPGDEQSTQPVINADGTHVAFVSKATNFLPGDTQKHNDIFRYTIATGALELVSARSGTTNVYGGGSSSEPTISKDGNLVSFTSFSGNLNAGFDNNGSNDVFVRNMGSSTVFGIAPNATKLISVEPSTTAASGNKQSFDSWISSDGRYIAFRSDAGNLTPGDANDTRDTFVRDLQSNTTKIISVTPAGVSGNSASDSNSISGDGRLVTFQSKANDLVGNDGNANTDVFLRDTTTNTTTLLSVNRFGTNSAGGFSEFPALSQDGSFATFSSTAGDIVEGDTNGREDIFLRDLVRGPISLLSTNTAGAPSNGRSFDPFISANSSFVVFTSTASDMATGDTNGKSDIFLATAPTTAGDSAIPTATVAGADAATIGATELRFSVNLADDTALDTVGVGPLTVTKPGGATVTTTGVTVVGSGKSAVATYTLPFAGGIAEADVGSYSVTTTANAIKDASGKAIPGGTAIGTFALAIGDTTGPDLIVTKPGKLKASYIGGSTKAAYKWKLQNNGPGTITNATVQYTIYTSADDKLDPGDASVGTVSKLYKKLKPTKSKAVASKFVFPNSINGNYFVIVKADTTNVVSESNESNNATPSAVSALIQPPFTDLEPTFVGRPSRGTAGADVTSQVTIKNNGNVKFTDLVPVELVVTTDKVLGTGTPLVTATQKISLAPGQTKTVTIKSKLPAGLPAAAYQIGANIDPANGFAESNEDNNTGFSFDFQSFQ